MKISDLIRELTRVEKSKGDIEVVIEAEYFCGDSTCAAVAEIESVEVQEARVALSGLEI